jgi:hypothetical protein
MLGAEITMRIFTRAPAAGSSAGDGVTVPPGSAEIDDDGTEENI